MSLPDSGRLVLQGPAMPGDPTQANPKKSAIFLRLSAETFAALERDTKMDIELTGQPKLYIGDACFTMRSADIGETSQELYVRMLQANKAGAAPLKLQGNIVGRFAVERELGEKVEKDIRERSHQLEKSKHDRTIQRLNEIPKDLAPTKTQVKSKKPTKVTKSTPAGHAPTDPSRSASTSLQPSRVASQRPSPRPSNPSADTARSHQVPTTRSRLLHYVALHPRTGEEIMRNVAGQDMSIRSEVETLISQTLEKIPVQRNGTNPDAGKWQLKTEAWLHVRPFDYDGLKPTERSSLARQARLAYGSLNIPQTDSRWANVREQPNASDSTRSSRSPLPPAAAPPETKKPMPTKKIQPVQTIVKRRVVGTVQAKDESVRIPKIEREATPTIPPAKTTARREPGSGFRAKSDSSTPPATDSPMLSAAQPVKKPSPAPRREAPSPAPGPSRSSAAMPPPQGKPQPRERTPLSQDIKKKKEPSSAAHPDSSREKTRPTLRDEPLDRIRKRARDAAESEYSDREPMISFKKRKLEESRQDKERERDWDRDTPKEREKGRQGERERERPKEKARDRVEVKTEQRNPSLPKKPVTQDASPRVAQAHPKPIERERDREGERGRERGREPTPRNAGRSPLPPRPRSPALPPRPAAHDRLASVASNNSSHSRYDDHSSRNGSTKGRHTPSFTSSEDDSSESKTVNRKRRDVRRASPPPRKTEARPRKLPSDPEALRDLWDRLYPEYIRKHKRHRRLHDQLSRALSSNKDAEIEIDFDLPSDSELRLVNEDAAKAHEEMIKIKSAYYHLTGEKLDDSYDSQ
ncbi:hypothetical protein PHLGIDRAFT_124712 [Phlebiopsis gigantea 11061_1 CR5-6]|uniref:RNA polymerase II elongation factor ELL N-terminal domain-containing protein n=1 Tax=Phlebiopsis gigantea (strain 11061_1 CR5-6) TaxID=745531 RepID=A0A0C3SF68_PHLG1|nr:hypothetical protein PHLGIDRAFT_124712 [Phlebiopsis gigantea 11061_1 CR5-6]